MTNEIESTDNAEQILICGTMKSGCIFGKVPNHPPPHACNKISPVVDRCRGEWLDDGTIVTYPTGETSYGEALARSLGMMGIRW